MKRLAFGLLVMLAGNLAATSNIKAQILGGHGGPVVIHSGNSHSFGGYNGVAVTQYREPLAAGHVASSGFAGYPNEPILSARTVTSAGTWPQGTVQPPAPVNYATIGPRSMGFYGWNSFWWYDPSQGSPIWNPYNRGRY
ncbi:MAG: hypothetical protein RJA81_2269 [Planctomycetota bacterium]|jgi:hypothetical protein